HLTLAHRIQCWPILLLLSVVAGIPAAHAQPPQCPTNTNLQAILDLGSCRFGYVIYSNFQYLSQVAHLNGTYDNIVLASQVSVRFSNANGNPANPVISFLGPWTVTGADRWGYLALSYETQTTSSTPMVGSSVTATGTSAYVDGAEGDSLV